MQEIKYILDLCASDTREITSNLRALLSAKLTLFTMKSELGLVSSAYTAKPKQSMTDQLGFGASPEAKRELSYQRYVANPTLCTEEEISLAKTYMFENGMMTDSEEEEFLNESQ